MNHHLIHWVRLIEDDEASWRENNLSIVGNLVEFNGVWPHIESHHLNAFAIRVVAIVDTRFDGKLEIVTNRSNVAEAEAEAKAEVQPICFFNLFRSIIHMLKRTGYVRSIVMVEQRPFELLSTHHGNDDGGERGGEMATPTEPSVELAISKTRRNRSIE